MSLNEKHDVIDFPATDYVYVEKVGSFMQTAPQAWQELYELKSEIAKHNQILGAFSMYKIEQNLYRAGFKVKAAAENLPPGVKHVRFEGGTYIRFELRGSYSQLPDACGRVFEIVRNEDLKTTDQFYIENYTNDPHTTKEDQLLTEILIPTVASPSVAKK